MKHRLRDFKDLLAVVNSCYWPRDQKVQVYVQLATTEALKDFQSMQKSAYAD